MLSDMFPRTPGNLAFSDVREKCHAFCHASMMAWCSPIGSERVDKNRYVRKIHDRTEFQCGYLVNAESMAEAESRVVLIAVDASDHAEKAFNCK